MILDRSWMGTDKENLVFVLQTGGIFEIDLAQEALNATILHVRYRKKLKRRKESWKQRSVSITVSWQATLPHPMHTL